MLNDNFKPVQVQDSSGKITNTLTKEKSTPVRSSSSFSLFKLIIVVAFIYITVRILYTGSWQNFSIESLLNNLSELPQVSTSVKSFSNNFFITADWTVFNFLRDFLNWFANIISIIVWLGSSLIDVILWFSALLFTLFV